MGRGRQKGTPNKKTQSLQERAQALGCDPLEILFYFAKGDWKALGYESATIVKMTTDGGTFDEERIPAAMRLQAAKEAAQYLYAKRKAVEHSSTDNKPIVLKYSLDEKDEKAEGES